MASKSLYSNNTAPFVALGDKCGILNRSINDHFDSTTIRATIPTTEIIELHPLAKLAIADTFHDLCQPRKGYEPNNFRSDILKTILPLQTILPNGLIRERNGDEMYGDALNNLFGGSVSKSSLEEHVNRYFEDFYNLQPIYSLLNTITYDYVLDNMTNDSNRKEFITKLINANGSLKLVVPDGFISFTEYIASKSDRIFVQRILTKFITSFLHGNIDQLFDGQAPMQIRFLFDAGGSNVAKIYRHAGSNGIRYNTMACTADSASSSDEMLDPLLPNEYEPAIGDDVIDVTTNFLSCDRVRMYYKVNSGKTFGLNGTKCFSVNFTTTSNTSGKSTENDGSTASYFFGSKILGSSGKDDNTMEDTSKPCGGEGASVSYLGRTFAHLEGLRKKPINPEEQKRYLNVVKNEINPTHIPIGDGRILKLFDSDIINDADQLNLLKKVLTDYKRTGDYEQALSLVRAIQMREGSNALNFTFVTGDLLSGLFARLNGIPVAYQTGVGSISLFRNDTYRGTPEQIRVAQGEQILFKKYRLLNDTYARYKEVDHVFGGENGNTIQEILNQLITIVGNNNTLDLATSIEIKVIIDHFGNRLSGYWRNVDHTIRNPIEYTNEQVNIFTENEWETLRSHDETIKNILNTLKTYYPNLLKDGLLKSIPSSDLALGKITLPPFNLIVKKLKSQLSAKLDGKFLDLAASNRSKRQTEENKTRRIDEIRAEISEIANKVLKDTTLTVEREELMKYIEQKTSNMMRVVGGGYTSGDGDVINSQSNDFYDGVGGNNTIYESVSYCVLQSTYVLLNTCNFFLRDLNGRMAVQDYVKYLKYYGESLNNHLDNAFKTYFDSLQSIAFSFEISLLNILQDEKFQIVFALLYLCKKQDIIYYLPDGFKVTPGRKLFVDSFIDQADENSDTNTIVIIGLVACFSKIINNLDFFFSDRLAIENAALTITNRTAYLDLEQMYSQSMLGFAIPYLNKFIVPPIGQTKYMRSLSGGRTKSLKKSKHKKTRKHSENKINISINL